MLASELALAGVDVAIVTGRSASALEVTPYHNASRSRIVFACPTTQRLCRFVYARLGLTKTIVNRRLLTRRMFGRAKPVFIAIHPCTCLYKGESL